MNPLHINRIFWGAIYLCGLLIITGIFISGALPFFSYSTIPFISIAVITFLTALFARGAEVLWLCTAAVFLEGLFGGMSYSAHAAGFLGGVFLTNFLFKRFVKNHAPAADAALTAAGTAMWLLISAAVQMIGFRLGVFQYTISGIFLMRGFETTIILTSVIFLALVGVSNYSKYGSLARFLSS